MELNNRISQFHKNKITEKAVAVMAFFGEKILEMFMTANFYAFKQKKGESLRSLPTHHKTTDISRILFWKMPQGTWRSDSYSGRQMTGKFRKVASHYAPEPALGLFLNLPEGSAPWNPGTSMA